MRDTDGTLPNRTMMMTSVTIMGTLTERHRSHAEQARDPAFTKK